MLKILSGITEDRLNYFYKRIIEISKLGEEAGLIETDKFIWEIENELNVESTDDEEGENKGVDYVDGTGVWSLAEVEETINEFSDIMKRNKPIDIWLAEELLQRIETLEEISKRKGPKEENVDTIIALVNKGKEVGEKVLDYAYEKKVEECNKKTLFNITSIQGVIEQLDTAYDYFERKGKLTQERSSKIRKAKERAAWFRAKKKLEEAKVAEAGGRNVRASNLRGEATAILEQDWYLALPNEDAPKI